MLKGFNKTRNHWSYLKLNYLTETITEERNFKEIETLEIEWKNCKIKWKQITKKEKKESISKCFNWWELIRLNLTNFIVRKRNNAKKLLPNLEIFIKNVKKMKIKLKINRPGKGCNYWNNRTILNILTNWRKPKIVR